MFRHAVVSMVGVLLWVIPLYAGPNVVVLLADDQGWGDLSGHGNRNLRTPNIDSLAKDGATFERFFVQPVCSPTRAEFLTGRYAQRGGVRNVSLGGERLNLDEKTIADAFHKAGYRTGLFGKWHNGTQYPYHPNGRGFDEFYGYTSGHWGEYFDAEMDHNGTSVRGKGFMADDITTRAISFIKAPQDETRPFFCVVTFNTPHSPMQVPDTAWKPFENIELKMHGSNRGKEDLRHTRAALAMCENIDANVGRILQTLNIHKQESNTIVLYFSDNGPNGHRWNGEMKGIKGSTDEGGVRSVLHMRWKDKIPAGRTIKPIAAAIDLYPTIASLCGVPMLGNAPDGINMAEHLFNDKPTSERMLFQHWANQTSVRSQRYRLDATGKLFDMIDDPRQTKDLAAAQPALAKQHTSALDRWKKDVLAKLPKADDRAYPVGYHEQPRTFLPARDGVPGGEIRRSSAAPNCSFFTNWKQQADYMTWNVAVNNGGKYEAILHYTAPRQGVGTKLEMTLGKTTWRGTIEKEHDPALRGKENDRSPRGSESYMKDFARLSLGVQSLEKGPAILKLQATSIPQAIVGDVWGIELILQK